MMKQKKQKPLAADELSIMSADLWEALFFLNSIRRPWLLNYLLDLKAYLSVILFLLFHMKKNIVDKSCLVKSFLKNIYNLNTSSATSPNMPQGTSL